MNKPNARTRTRKHRNDYAHGKNGGVSGNPRYNGKGSRDSKPQTPETSRIAARRSAMCLVTTAEGAERSEHGETIHQMAAGL